MILDYTTWYPEGTLLWLATMTHMASELLKVFARIRVPKEILMGPI